MDICTWCDEPILSISMRAERNLPMHWECALRSAVGGVNHFRKLCACYGGDLLPDPEGLTRREAAIELAQAWMQRNPQM